MASKLHGVYDGPLGMTIMSGQRDHSHPNKTGKQCFICQQPIACGDSFLLRLFPSPKLIWHRACE